MYIIFALWMFALPAVLAFFTLEVERMTEPAVSRRNPNPGTGHVFSTPTFHGLR